MKKYVLFSMILFLFSCEALKGLDLSNVTLGMTKSEVMVKTKSFNTKTIGGKQYKDGNMEVFQVSEIIRKDLEVNDYWMYFFNDKLVSYEPINSTRWKAQDWDYNIDKIYYGLKN